MKEIMLDLETLGTGPNAAILSIGAVKFDLEKGEVSPDRFYVTVDLENSIDLGAVIDASTIKWWMGQSSEARGQFLVPGLQLADALNKLTKWIGEQDGMRVWGNGATFDNVLIRNAYQMAGVTCPWKYWNDMCYRTIKNLYPNVGITNRIGTYHNAVDDAQTQAEHIIRIFQTIKSGHIKSGQLTL